MSLARSGGLASSWSRWLARGLIGILALSVLLLGPWSPWAFILAGGQLSEETTGEALEQYERIAQFNLSQEIRAKASFRVALLSSEILRDAPQSERRVRAEEVVKRWAEYALHHDYRRPEALVNIAMIQTQILGQPLRAAMNYLKAAEAAQAEQADKSVDYLLEASRIWDQSGHYERGVILRKEALKLVQSLDGVSGLDELKVEMADAHASMRRGHTGRAFMTYQRLEQGPETPAEIKTQASLGRGFCTPSDGSIASP